MPTKEGCLVRQRAQGRGERGARGGLAASSGSLAAGLAGGRRSLTCSSCPLGEQAQSALVPLKAGSKRVSGRFSS